MAPGNSDRHSSHTGTIPKTKIRNNCNVPQEVVTPTRREMSSNLVTTSLDWVPVSEYNTRTNYNQGRKPSNNSSDHELTDLENAVSSESGFGRFVPVRPQPRALPLNAQNRENLAAEQSDDGGSNSAGGHSLHPYAHQLQNGMIPHTNHAAAAVMIVNPTTPNASTANIAQPYNAPSQSRNNLTRNLNTTRNNFEGNIHASNNNATPTSATRTGTKTVNLINNMYEQVQGNFNNLNENGHRETVRALGEAIVAACPDTASVERRLGQIREYIRVTSSLVDTMRNSEDEAFIEHTKEEYDELIGMIKSLKESESKLELILKENARDNSEVLIEEIDESIAQLRNDAVIAETDKIINQDKTCNIKSSNDNTVINNNLKKITNIENDQCNVQQDSNKFKETTIDQLRVPEPIIAKIDESNLQGECSNPELDEIESISCSNPNIKKDHENLNEVLRRNILSCVEKVQLIEEIKNKNIETTSDENQEIVVRPVSVQSNGSAYSESELWQNEIKNKMEMSQLRLAALKQQQKRLLKYQEEAKQQLEEINRERQSQEMHPSTSHDNLAAIQGQPISNYHPNRMYAANQIGVATTLPHSSEAMHGAGMANNLDNDHGHLAHSNHSHDDRMSQRETNMSNEDMARGEDSELEEDEAFLSEQGRILQHKLRELHLKKQHMENLVSEFQKLQMATRQASSRNTYSSSGEDSGEDEPTRKCNKSGNNMKNEDPYKLMEIKAIKAALQKTKDLMRSVENYEVDQLAGVTDESFQTQQHLNIHDNKSEGGGSTGGWSNDGSLCRVRNSLSQRHKFTNEQSQQQAQQQLQHQPQQPLQYQSQQQLQHQSQQPLQHQSQQQLHQAHQHIQQQLQHQSQQLQHQSQQMQHQSQQMQHHTQQLQHQAPHQQQQSHEANIASLQELAQELRRETEKIIGERTRIKDMVSNKDRKQKKVNEEVQAGPSSGSGPGPAERRQMQLRALLADKQRELEALINKEKTSSGQEPQTLKTDSRTASIVNQSYNSEHEEPDSQSEQVLIDSQDLRDSENYRGGGDSARAARSLNMLPQHLGSVYGSDSDTASRTKSNQRPRARRRQSQDRQSEDNNGIQANNTNQNVRIDPRIEQANVNMVPPTAQNGESPGNMPYPYLQQPCWNTNKSNQDMRTNQFTQNSHSQTMERLLGTPQMSFPPSMPFNVMMPYGMVGGCSCGCGFWGAWCWQQLVMQQREIQQLREQLNHLEERWRSENASHTLNNQVPPGNRANNYWDNFRSYSRQNLLSTNSKTNADGHLGAGSAHNPHPLVERSHNTLHHATSTPPSNTPKRNTNAATSTMSIPHSTQSNTDESNRTCRNNAYERSLSFSSAPDVLNINQNSEPDSSNGSHTRNLEDITAVPNVNINRQEVASNSFRNLNITNPIPEIIQSHSNNLNTSANSKKKSSSKLPAKNSTNRRNASLSYSETSNVNIVSTSEVPNPNLASTSREVHDKASSKLFDLLRENVYSEVTALIGVNESHPDFLIQLFRELQLISSEPLRQRVLQSIRNVLSQYSTIIENENAEDDNRSDAPGTSSEVKHFDRNSSSSQNACSSTVHIDNNVVHFLLQRCDEICTSEFLESLISLVTNSTEGRQQSKKRLIELLSKYEGMRVCEVSSDIIENLAIISSNNEGDESTQLTSEMSESSILQDVAGSLNLFSSSDTQLHQLNSCPYDIWPAHVHMDMEAEDVNDKSPRSSQEGKVDLINCSDMHNGDLAEADQTCRSELSNSNHETAQVETLPDVVDTEEATPTEAEAEWLGLDRVPTRLHMEESSGKQKD